MNTFEGTAAPPASTFYAELEGRLGYSLPKSFKDHYIINNGGQPAQNEFYVERDDSYLAIDNFYPVQHPSTIDSSTVEKMYDLLSRQKNAIPKHFLPFAHDPGNNKVCLDMKTGRVYVVYMDLGNPMKIPEAIKKVADSFANFISNLKEYEDEEV